MTGETVSKHNDLYTVQSEIHGVSVSDKSKAFINFLTIALPLIWWWAWGQW